MSAASDLADGVAALTEAVRQACADPADAISGLTELAGFIFTATTGIDAIGAATAAVTNATGMLIRRNAAISLALASADYEPTSYQDAIAVRDGVVAVLDGVIAEAGDCFDDATFTALRALRVAVVRDLNTRGASLAPVVTRSLKRNLPAVVLAYGLYGDSSRADDVLARNPVPHPGFLPTSIEVLAE